MGVYIVHVHVQYKRSKQAGDAQKNIECGSHFNHCFFICSLDSGMMDGELKRRS